MPLPLFNIEIRITAEGGPLARSVALRHPIYKNIRMVGGRKAGKAAVRGKIIVISTGQRATFGLTPTLSRQQERAIN
jgi:hypothetical protein